MKKLFSILIKINVAFLLILNFSACDSTNKNQLPRLENAEEKYDYSKFNQVFYDVITSNGVNQLHSMMIVKDGQVVYEKYAPGHTKDELHIMWSASKTFTATAIGFAQQEGLLNINDKVFSYMHEDEIPADASEWMKNITIENLLTMSSGLKADALNTWFKDRNIDWVKRIFNEGMKFEPGTKYSYNSLNTYLLSVIISRVSGQKLEDYLEPRLFEPLGIENHIWSQSPQGYSLGGWGLYINLESIAKMGQFLLQRGQWNNKQILDAAWVDNATSLHIYQYDPKTATPEEIEKQKNSDWGQGYAFQMWRGKHNSVRLDGLDGQYSIIFPDQNLVVAAFEDNNNPAVFFNSVYDNVLSQF